MQPNRVCNVLAVGKRLISASDKLFLFDYFVIRKHYMHTQEGVISHDCDCYMLSCGRDYKVGQNEAMDVGDLAG